MNYFLLPDTGLAPDLKAAVQLADLGLDLQVPAALVTPDGRAPLGFNAAVPVLDENTARAQIRPRDTFVITRPDPFPKSADWPGRPAFLCQARVPPPPALLAHPDLTLLAGTPPLTRWLENLTRRPVIHCGLHVADRFFYAGAFKHPNTMTLLPGCDPHRVDSIRTRNPDLVLIPPESSTESEMADRLQRSEYGLAPAGESGNGLFLLEALAAGCVILKPAESEAPEDDPLDIPLETAEPDRLGERLAWLRAPDQSLHRARRREEALGAAWNYRRRLHRRRLETLLEGPLAFWR